MGAADYFLKIDGIEGEAADAKHKGSIDIESFSFAEVQAGAAAYGGGAGAGKVKMGNLNFVMKANKASPRIFLACATGEHIKQAVLSCRKAGGKQQEFMKITLSDLLVSNYQLNGSAGAGVIPVEQFSLNFAKIEYEYSPQKANGELEAPIKAGYDLKANKKV